MHRQGIASYRLGHKFRMHLWFYLWSLFSDLNEQSTQTPDSEAKFPERHLWGPHLWPAGARKIFYILSLRGYTPAKQMHHVQH